MRVVETTGEYTLLEYQNKARSNYYILQKGSAKPLELIYYVNHNSLDNLIKFTVYKEQLLQVLAGEIEKNSSLKSSIENAEYTEHDLSKIFHNLSNNTGNHTGQRETRYPAQFVLSGGVSVNNPFITGTDNPLYPESKMTLSKSVSPVAGIGFIVYSQRNFGRNFMMPLITYTNLQTSGSIKTGLDTLDQQLRAQALSLDLHIGRNIIQTENSKWYVSGFFSGGFFLENTKELTINNASRRKETLKGRNGFFTLCLQTGNVFLNNIGIWARVQPGLKTIIFLNTLLSMESHSVWG